MKFHSFLGNYFNSLGKKLEIFKQFTPFIGHAPMGCNELFGHSDVSTCVSVLSVYRYLPICPQLEYFSQNAAIDLFDTWIQSSGGGQQVCS